MYPVGFEASCFQPKAVHSWHLGHLPNLLAKEDEMESICHSQPQGSEPLPVDPQIMQNSPDTIDVSGHKIGVPIILGHHFGRFK